MTRTQWEIIIGGTAILLFYLLWENNQSGQSAGSASGTPGLTAPVTQPSNLSAWGGAGQNQNGTTSPGGGLSSTDDLGAQFQYLNQTGQ